MTTSATNPPDLSGLLAAVVAKLRAAAGVTALVGQRIYSGVPESETLPLVVVSVTAQEWDTKDMSGWDATVEVTAHSDGRGAKESLSIAKACHSVLHRAGSWSMGTDGGAMVLFQRIRTESRPAADGLGFQTANIYQALINQD
jgi:hypothetical protein